MLLRLTLNSGAQAVLLPQTLVSTSIAQPSECYTCMIWDVCSTSDSKQMSSHKAVSLLSMLRFVSQTEMTNKFKFRQLYQCCKSSFLVMKVNSQTYFHLRVIIKQEHKGKAVNVLKYPHPRE